MRGADDREEDAMATGQTRMSWLMGSEVWMNAALPSLVLLNRHFSVATDSWAERNTAALSTETHVPLCAQSAALLHHAARLLDCSTLVDCNSRSKSRSHVAVFASSSSPLIVPFAARHASRQWRQDGLRELHPRPSQCRMPTHVPTTLRGPLKGST